MPRWTYLLVAASLAACNGGGAGAGGASAEPAWPSAAPEGANPGGVPEPANPDGEADPPGGAPARAVTLERAFPALSFTRPTDLQAPADGTGRLFVLEQAGRIRAFGNEPDAAAASVFLDLRDRVASGGEMGLLGLAFHPRYRTNRQFFVNYTTTSGGPRRTHVSRFTARADRPGEADPASEQVILSFPQPYSNHNGGQLAFGPDGYLYIGTGDGGAAGDPHGNGQSKTTLLGKLLRIDVDKPAGGKAYGIPPDNPFQGGGGSPEIFAWGLRNLWRFSIDADTGRIWGADVGQNQVEEVDVLEKGQNYGWAVMEGTRCYQVPDCNKSAFTLPVAEYTRALGQSITGGYVYRGKAAPALAGRYLYADYASGRIWALPYGGKPSQILDSDLNPSSFGQDADRELYLLDHGGGGLYRFRS